MSDDRTADQLIENGVALIAQGMFRKGSREGQGDPRGAFDSGMSAVSVIRELAFDFYRLAEKQKAAG